MTDLCSLLFELSSQDRLNILRQVEDEPMVVTKISKKLDLAVQETSRHLSRLRKIGLAERDHEGFNRISRYGSLVLKLLPALEFSHRYSDYLSTHDIDRIPHSFLQRLGDLNGSELPDDIAIGFHNVDRLLVESEEYIHSMTDQYLVSHSPLVTEALERGVLMKNIDDPFSLPPQDIPEEWSNPSFRKALSQGRADGSLQERFLEKFEVYLYMSEKSVAVVGFPKLDGKFDYLGFSSRDERMHDWCSDLFDHYWEVSRPRDEMIEEYREWVSKTRGAGEALKLYGQGRGREVNSRISSKLGDKGVTRGDKLTFMGLVLYRGMT